jgi:hypothetical protein
MKSRLLSIGLLFLIIFLLSGCVGSGGADDGHGFYSGLNLGLSLAFYYGGIAVGLIFGAVIIVLIAIALFFLTFH